MRWLLSPQSLNCEFDVAYLSTRFAEAGLFVITTILARNTSTPWYQPAGFLYQFWFFTDYFLAAK